MGKQGSTRARQDGALVQGLSSQGSDVWQLLPRCRRVLSKGQRVPRGGLRESSRDDDDAGTHADGPQQSGRNIQITLSKLLYGNPRRTFSLTLTLARLRSPRRSSLG